jgi:hypothetical protein
MEGWAKMSRPCSLTLRVWLQAWLQDRCMVGIEYDEASPKKPREARRATEAAAYIPQIRTAELYTRRLQASPIRECVAD